MQHEVLTPFANRNPVECVTSFASLQFTSRLHTDLPSESNERGFCTRAAVFTDRCSLVKVNAKTLPYRYNP